MLVELSVVEQRYNAVMEVLSGLPVVEVAERYGVSRQSVHTWLRRYQAGGLAGLADRSHRPRSCPHQTPAEVEARVCELRRQHPGWGPRRLGYELIRGGLAAAEVPSRAAIWRILVRNQLIVPRPRRRREYARWERQAPMQLWQLDIMGGVWLEDGAECKLVTGVDDHSRFCVLARVVEQATSRAVCAAFTAALDRYGVPEEVLTDNGRQFTGRYGKPRPAEVLFERILRDNGITQRLTGIRSPTTTGKIERFHKTVRTELLGRRGPFASLIDAQQAVDTWVEDYNTHRPHQALGMRTPAERFHPSEPAAADHHAGDARAGMALAVPSELATVSPAPPLVAAGQGRAGPVELDVEVPACGNLGLGGRQLWLGRALGGRTVTVWADLWSIHLSLDGRLLKTLPSRYTPDQLAALATHPTGRPAGPPPPTAVAAALADAEVVEVERMVNGGGLVGVAGRQLSVGLPLAGRLVTLRLQATVAHVISDGVLVKTLPAPIPAPSRARLRGARAATSPLAAPTGPVSVQRRVSHRGSIQLAGQRVHVGLPHAGKLVTVQVTETQFRIYDQTTPITTAARHTRKEVTRFKASEHRRTTNHNNG